MEEAGPTLDAAPREPGWEELTPLQVRVLAAAASGQTLSNWAGSHGYATSTVYNVLSEAKRRMHSTTVAAAVMRAHAFGYLAGPTGADPTVMPIFLDPNGH